MSGWSPDDAWGDTGAAGFVDENVNPSGANDTARDGKGFGDNGFNNDFGGGDTAAPSANDDNRCRNCGSDGHFARNCTEPRKGMGACFNCGEEGHSKAECTNPRVFKGPCRICSQEGHPATECPERPPDVCKNCKMEGHKTMDCKDNRKFDLNNIPDKCPEEAWAALTKASNARDLEEFREGIKVYSKAAPQATFVDIENKMREDNFKVYLIAMEKPVGDSISLIDLQGKLNRQYVVGFYYSEKPQRANLRMRWPATPEENLERLADAGFPYDRQIPKCGNCGEMGHTARGCKQERAEYERVEVKCVNCSEPGHRARDCTEKRRDRFACRNCGESDHKASECPNPRSAEGVECNKCNEMGHFAKDCPQASAPRTCRNCGSEDHIARDCDKPRDVSTVTCRNCDAVGHFSRDCPQKKDWSKVKCNNCGEMGHTVKRCPTAQAEGEGYSQQENDFGKQNDYAMDTSADGGWNSGTGNAEWNNGTSDTETPAPAAGGEWVAEGAGW